MISLFPHPFRRSRDHAALVEPLAVAAGKAERAVVAAVARGDTEAGLPLRDLAEIALYARRAAIALDRRPVLDAETLGLDGSW